MESNTDKLKCETPLDKYKSFFNETEKKIGTLLLIGLTVFIAVFLFLNLAAVGFGYQNVNSSTLKETCSSPYDGVRYYVLPGYITGCHLGRK